MAVAGIPDAIYGEVAAAVVVAHPGTRLSREQIQDELKDRVARYKIPQKILFVDEIPKTPGLKVDKKHIRTMLEDKDMIKANFVTAREAAAMVKDGDTVCTVGMTLVSASESILKALEKDFIETGHPCGMTLYIRAVRVTERMVSSTLHMKE